MINYPQKLTNWTKDLDLGSVDNTIPKYKSVPTISGTLTEETKSASFRKSPKEKRLEYCKCKSDKRTFRFDRKENKFLMEIQCSTCNKLLFSERKKYKQIFEELKNAVSKNVCSKEDIQMLLSKEFYR